MVDGTKVRFLIYYKEEAFIRLLDKIDAHAGSNAANWFILGMKISILNQIYSVIFDTLLGKKVVTVIAESFSVFLKSIQFEIFLYFIFNYFTEFDL